MLKQFLDISLYCAALAFVAIVAFCVLGVLKKALSSPVAQGPGLSLHDARRFLKEGKISAEEFEHLKKLIVEAERNRAKEAGKSAEDG